MPTSPLRVVIASRLFSPEATAASFRMTGLADALADSGTDVAVVTTRPPAATTSEPVRPGIRIARWPVVRDRTGAIRGYVSYASFDAPLFFRLLFRRADVFVAEAPPTTGLVVRWVSRLRRIPYVYYPGDVWTDGVEAMGAGSVVVRLMRWIESRAVRGAARVLAVSPEVAERIAALGASAERVVDVGNGIDTTAFTPDVTPRTPPRPYFVYTGTMSEWQRPELFVRALARLDDRDVELRFFGQGSAEAELRRLADELAPGRVHFGGVVEPRDAAAWIRGAVAALVSIVPGIGYDFARPTKTYAAAACGTPVVFAGAETGGRLVEEAGLGDAVPFDEVAVAAAMTRMLERTASGDTENRRVERADWARENVSLRAVGMRAARVVAEVSRRP